MIEAFQIVTKYNNENKISKNNNCFKNKEKKEK